MAFAGAVRFGLLAILAKRRSAPSNSVTLGDSLRMCKQLGLAYIFHTKCTRAGDSSR